MGMRHGALLLAGVAAFLVGCGGAGMRAEAAGPQRLSFADLAGWNTDDQSAALAAFKRSCARILKLSPSAPLDTKGGDDDRRQEGRPAQRQQSYAEQSGGGYGGDLSDEIPFAPEWR